MEKDLDALEGITRRQLELGLEMVGEVDQEEVDRLGREGIALAERLYPRRGATDGEEARLCLALLMAYSLSPYGPADRAERLDGLFRRSAALLPRLRPSALKVRLLVWSYAGVEDGELLAEANALIATWNRWRLTDEQSLALREMEAFFAEPDDSRRLRELKERQREAAANRRCRAQKAEERQVLLIICLALLGIILLIWLIGWGIGEYGGERGEGPGDRVEEVEGPSRV